MISRFQITNFLQHVGAEDFVFATAAFAARGENGTRQHNADRDRSAGMREAAEDTCDPHIKRRGWDWNNHNDTYTD